MPLELERTLTAEPRPPTAPGVAVLGPRSAPPGLASGRQLGHFRIERPLGAGGMGEVYLATDLALDRPVAIKVLPDALAGDTVRRERLVREARAQARIVHPNVGHIYFIGEAAGFMYFAMELVHGMTLTDRIAQGPLSIDEAISVVRGAALGLREAQRNGFTHRDIKPSNLMIDHHGVVKVLDFGLAAGAAARSDSGAAGEEPGGPIAQTSLAGTPLYMAPEQARGEPIDHRADIYALGATLYHLVAGKPPFVADTIEQLASLHATAARPFTQAKTTRKRIAIDALCAKMMAPDPADRFASYDELLRALEVASSELSRPAGFWVRLLAGSVELLAFAMTLVAAGGITSAVTGRSVNADDLVSLGALVLFSAAAWAKWGRTPMQALFELEVIDVVTLRPPTLRAALKRSIAKYGLLLLPALLEHVLSLIGETRLGIVTTLIGVLGVVALLGALAEAAGRAGKRTPWDRIAGTLVRYRPSRRAEGSVTAAPPVLPS